MVQALEAIRKMKTEKSHEIKEFKLKLDHLKTHRDSSQKLKNEVADGQERDRDINAQMQSLEDQIQVLKIPFLL